MSLELSNFKWTCCKYITIVITVIVLSHATCQFVSTLQGKHVDGGCNASGVAYTKPKKYRQYMNRRGGFNRMLDHIK